MSSFWRQRRVFVTGATGLLGSRLVEQLSAQAADVTCLVRDWTPASRLVQSGVINRVNVVRGELEDLLLLIRALNEYEIDTVFHLGAQTIVGTAMRSALSTLEANVRGTWNLLQACHECGGLVKRVVVASSDKAYGSHDKLPYTEQTPLAGTAPYDVSKSCADLICACYAKTYGVPVAVTRCGNLYGPGDLNFNRLIPGTIRSALLGERPVIRSDGKMTRDYVYVDDAVSAYLTLAEQLERREAAGRGFNFGNQSPRTVLEVVEAVLDAVGRPELEPIIQNQARGEIESQYLDCTLARKTFGWKPAYPLSEGLAKTIPWYREHLAAAGLLPAR